MVFQSFIHGSARSRERKSGGQVGQLGSHLDRGEK